MVSHPAPACRPASTPPQPAPPQLAPRRIPGACIQPRPAKRRSWRPVATRAAACRPTASSAAAELRPCSCSPRLLPQPSLQSEPSSASSALKFGLLRKSSARTTSMASSLPDEGLMATPSERLAWDEIVRAEEEEVAAQDRAKSRQAESSDSSDDGGGEPAREPPPNLTGFERALWAAFTLADRDGNGKLSRLEFMLALKAAGVIDDDVEAIREWKRADTDASGAVEWDEFMKLGKRRKALATLTERLGARAGDLERAAMLIQKRSKKSLLLKVRPHDGVIRPTHGTARV